MEALSPWSSIWTSTSFPILRLSLHPTTILSLLSPDRNEWEWEEEARSFTSKGKVLFPEANYTQFKEMSPSDLFDLFLDKNILALIATRSCEYAMAQFGMPVSISLFR
jgi:hypothetical protein